MRWSEDMGFKVKIEEYSVGDVAGIKSASIHISGQYAYGWLRTETGIHRLVGNHLLIQVIEDILPLLQFLFHLK